MRSAGLGEEKWNPFFPLPAFIRLRGPLCGANLSAVSRVVVNGEDTGGKRTEKEEEA